MVWLLTAISIALLLMNVLLILTVIKQRLDKDPERVHEKMAEFVAQLEQENNELYNKLTIYVKDRETQLLERVERLERNKVPVFEEMDTPEKSNMDPEKIIQLSRQGFSSKQIAKVLQADYGEVELVVNMNKKLHGNSKVNGVL
ncbi:hypothetical protein B481_3522 [Planococcus halocryophilus Or1]|uniref:Uncharacterized protein n=1 Tax=Planococcus halocryophilus TaxID=1215089 RepID=A0A1C7DTV8_9BACL|nr:hypothetical protein [Planococcus halocryophilus]ANU14837.1 hypothetical protein BBI08_13690 [Planococcus halocryophilus]EMF45213.1 hypothetical protein B481_3522 [Planococcus halocryophilus Or1]